MVPCVAANHKCYAPTFLVSRGEEGSVYCPLSFHILAWNRQRPHYNAGIASITCDSTLLSAFVATKPPFLAASPFDATGILINSKLAAIDYCQCANSGEAHCLISATLVWRPNNLLLKIRDSSDGDSSASVGYFLSGMLYNVQHKLSIRIIPEESVHKHCCLERLVILELNVISSPPLIKQRPNAT